MDYIWVGFIGGAAAFAHCLGMCGGFSLYLARGRARDALRRQLLWHMGRIFIYVFFGTLAGFAGSVAARFLHQTWMQSTLAYISGIVIVIMGLSLLGLLPVRLRTSESFLASCFTQLFKDATARGAFLMGMATGCLPCPIVIGFLVVSMHLATPVDGMAIMAAVGLGTTWSLLLLAFVGNAVTAKMKFIGARAGGMLLVCLGLVTMLRGTPLLHHLMGCGGCGSSISRPLISSSHITH